MTETYIGCAVAGATMLVSIPLVIRHYIRERQRDIALQQFRKYALLSLAKGDKSFFVPEV